MKNSRVATYIDADGVKHTWPLNKSKHTVWAQGLSNYTRGIRGTLGTVNEA